MANVFLTGASGFMGRRLAARLLSRGHTVRGLVRRGSESRVAPGTEVVVADPLDAAGYRDRVRGCDTFVHLVGVAHPSPAKAAQFRSIDLASAKAALAAATAAGVRHFVYVSVAHPAPVMHEYIAARSEAEDGIRASGLNATILRPWYVLGPGRRWPVLLLPFYWLMEALPSTRDTARRLGLVTIGQMLAAQTAAVEHPPDGVRIVEVPEIRAAAAQ
jgi:nucleoside-diphosphate-sugar epimerase